MNYYNKLFYNIFIIAVATAIARVESITELTHADYQQARSET